MNTTKLICLFLFTFLFLSGSLALRSDDTKKLNDIDAFFLRVLKNKNSIPASTIQTWIKIQKNLYDADEIIRLSKNENTTQMGNYILGFAYNIIGLYDISAVIEQSIGETDNKAFKRDILSDKARNYENMGDFTKACELRKEILKNHTAEDKQEMKDFDLRSAATACMKAGDYDNCIKYVNQMQINEKNSYLWGYSAKAYAYQKKFPEAEAELKKVVEVNNDAKEYYDELKSSNPEEFWAKDYERNTKDWQPVNKIKDSELNSIDNLLCSKFAIDFWFIEIYNLNSKFLQNDITPYNPVANNSKYCFVIIKGVPFISFRFDNINHYNNAKDSLISFKNKIDEPSLFDEKMDVKNKILTTSINNKFISFVVHTDWQEALIKKEFPDAKWDEM